MTPQTLQPSVASSQFAHASSAFLAWLETWLDQLPNLDLESYMQDNNIRPDQVAVVSADLIVGFAYKGRLSSPRIANVVQPAADLFTRAYALGVRQFVLLQEYHSHDAPEFDQFGPHGIRGTEEAETVEALASLPFADRFTVIHKNSLHPAFGTRLGEWLSQRPQLNTFIVAGDCTDLCVYQNAMYFKLSANAVDKRANVLLPENCVQTYDLPVEIAQPIGAMPHDGDFLHALFLYHMALNGIQVVKSIS